MLTKSVEGDNTMTDEESNAVANMAHVITLSSQMSALEVMSIASKHLKELQTMLKDRKLTPEARSKNVKAYIKEWDKQQKLTIEELKREIAALHAIRHLAHVDPLTATRH